MAANSLAMAAPLRPSTMNAVNSGAISRSTTSFIIFTLSSIPLPSSVRIWDSIVKPTARAAKAAGSSAWMPVK